jgi:uncharacterized protein (TIGR02271 family)
MPVKSSDGEKLGKVVACQVGGFVVEKGFLFPRDLTVTYERIKDIRNGEIVLAMARAELSEPGARPLTSAEVPLAPDGPMAAEPLAARMAEEARTTRGAFTEFGKGGEIRVPLVEEEIIATKHVETVGEVHVRKEIITEEKQITVPVTREVIRVERVAVNHAVGPGEKIFEKESYDFPIREEHVTVEKRAVVHEELRVGKEIQLGEETASATVRRERAEVETQGPIRRAEGGGLPSREASQPQAMSAGAAKH